MSEAAYQRLVMLNNDKSINWLYAAENAVCTHNYSQAYIETDDDMTIKYCPTCGIHIS